MRVKALSGALISYKKCNDEIYACSFFYIVQAREGWNVVPSGDGTT
jgi:hypothetical protein